MESQNIIEYFQQLLKSNIDEVFQVALPKGLSIFNFAQAKIVNKPWGFELWVAHEDVPYAYKIIYLKEGTRTSLQYHNEKIEHSVIFAGEINFYYKNDKSEEILKVRLGPGHVIKVAPPAIHRIEAITDVLLVEASTNKLDDVVRVDDDYSRFDGKIDSEHERQNNSKFNYKVIILAAGKGQRLSGYTTDVNKALLPVNFKGVISYVVEKFPKEVEIIVALGYEKETLKEYLCIAHPDRNFVFVEVDKITGPGSGPGYSLLCCRQHLNCHFIISTVDTIVLEEVPPPTRNWLGIAKVEDTSLYNSVKLKDGLVTVMKDKVACGNTHAFIGLCGVYDHEVFWNALSRDKTLINNEIQLSNGLQALIEHNLYGIEFTWFDTGNIDNFNNTREYYERDTSKFDFSKTEEFIYFIEDKVVKYFKDEEIVKERIDRAEVLKGFVPDIESSNSHFYRYYKVPGITMYRGLSDKIIEEFLTWLNDNFWQVRSLNRVEREIFQKCCREFYLDKTNQRIELYYKRFQQRDDTFIVNGIKVSSLNDLLSLINWDNITNGVPSRYHGDLQFDNVLITKEKSSPFVLLDWRQNFAGLVKYGDLYYDLAKLYGGMLISYDLIKKNKFSYHQTGNEVNLDLILPVSLLKAREIYEDFILKNGYDLKKIKIITAIIFLNMAPLHHAPFSFLLHHLGKLELYKVLKQIINKGI